MSQRLNIKITLGSRSSEFPLDYNLHQNQAKIEIRSILRLINKFLSMHNIQVSNYLNIWVIANSGKENLFKIRRNSTFINLILNENSVYEIRVVLEDIEDKQNLLKFFHSNSEQYTRLSNNIDRIIEESKEEEKKRGQKCMRPIDIAYFFADPLVTVSKNKIITKHEVSYQLEYDKFIELVKKEEFGNNFRIEMMVATKTNIKNTLFDGASILHFACHGKKDKGNLQIESETSVGELVDLEHSQFMNLLDIRTALPKLIIFNVCYSSTLAKLISSSKRIITIGYNDEASDYVCEVFTREFYMGLFKNREPVRQLFHRIRNEIMEKDPKEGKKLCIYPEDPFPNEDEESFFGNVESKQNYFKKWTLSESMRENDSLGVKSEMFTFIKQYLTNGERISFFFLKGGKKSGKTDFMKKTRIYIMNRKVFTEDFHIDLRNKDDSYIYTILQLRLEREDVINKRMNELKELSKERRTNPIIIFDHAEKLLKIQYGKFIEFIQNKLMKELRYGKIVIITRNVTPIVPEEAEAFKRAHAHLKDIPHIEPTEFLNFIKRYANETIKQTALNYCLDNAYPYLKLAKAIKRSRSLQELSDICEDSEFQQRPPASLTPDQIEESIKEIERDLNTLHECATIKIEENHYIFLSTIFMEVSLEKAQQYTNLSCTRSRIENQVQETTDKFNLFIKKVFKVLELGDQLPSELRDKIYTHIPIFLHLSLKLASFIYIYKDFRLFERHLLDCEKLYVLISGFYLQELKKKAQFQEMVAHYHLKILLTLYSYYTQNEYQLKHRRLQFGQQRSSEEIQNQNTFHRKAEIIMDEIKGQFDKKEYEYLLNTLHSLYLINNMAQELHYDRNYNLFVQNAPRRESEVFEPSNQEGDLEEQAALIDKHHERIVIYWRACKEVEKYSKHYQTILQQESITLIEVIVLKEIVYNLRQFEAISESFLSENVGLYISYYIQIMEKLQNDGIFNDKSKGLFHHHTCEALKPLFQEYLKAYIETFFTLSKIKQNLSKDYSLPIFYELISLCEKSQYISGISSIKKMIELHINEQFFNSWTCTAFISIPLLYEKGGAELKCNIKRYENNVYNFLQNFYENQLDKEVKFELKLMNEEILRKYEQEKRHLIQLIICDLTEESEKIYLENNVAKSIPYHLRSLALPNAPIIIYFGVNVRAIEQIYNKRQSIAIWINISQSEKEMELMLEKEKSLTCIEAYNRKIGIYYHVLEYFYCSFCRHFFNGNHSLFTEQVRNSFDLAKAETIIKTKIRYSSNREFQYEREIQAAIDQIDSNLQYLVTSNYGQELVRKPAYHFIYKQQKSEKQKGKGFQVQGSILELGCNYEICELLSELSRIKCEREVNLMIYYKSEPMLHSFLNTLRIKLIKMGMYEVNPPVSNANYQEYRTEMDKLVSRAASNDFHDILEENSPSLTPFIDLEEDKFANELTSPTPALSSTVRIFFTRRKYKTNERIHKKLTIEENYKTNKVEFEYFYLHCKSLRPNAPEKRLHQHYKDIIGQPSSSLQDMKYAIQRL